jgi:hypothetical protein
MWQFMNPDMIIYIFGFDISYQKDVENDKFTKRHMNT